VLEIGEEEEAICSKAPGTFVPAGFIGIVAGFFVYHLVGMKGLEQEYDMLHS
jgi:hypothetical protein